MKANWLAVRKPLSRLLHKPGHWVISSFALCLILLAITGKLLTPYDPLEVNLSVKFQPPNSQFWMGTDNLGRDIASRVIAGTQLAIQSCFVILASATIIGLLIGIVSGYYGGLVDEIFMRISDIFIAFPGLVLALAIAAALGPNLTNAMIAISAVWWPSYARLVRGQVLAIKERNYIEAAISLGAGDLWIMLHLSLIHISSPRDS